MKFNVNQKDLQEALSYCQGVIEKRSTLEILSNVLLNANNSKLTITATDLDLIFIHQIQNPQQVLSIIIFMRDSLRNSVMSRIGSRLKQETSLMT